MNCLSDQFLSGTRLSKNQYRGISTSDILHLFEDSMHHAAPPDDAAKGECCRNFLFQIRVVEFELLSQPV